MIWLVRRYGFRDAISVFSANVRWAMASYMLAAAEKLDRDLRRELVEDRQARAVARKWVQGTIDATEAQKGFRAIFY